LAHSYLLTQKSTSGQTDIEILELISLDGLRRLLAKPSTSVQLGILGVIAGISSALVIILFRVTIEKTQGLFLPHFDNFTELDLVFRFLLPFIAVVILILIGFRGTKRDFRMGIPFAIHWLKVKKGAMPLRNAFYQFFGGAVALISGFSVGREGPAVHLGATFASYFGNLLRLPYNSIRTLTGCGISAAIAASFNTPLAAVVFVMEVVFREYKIHIFIPIMLSAVAGTLLTRMVFGDQHELSIFSQAKFDTINYAYLIICSAGISAVAYAFNTSLMKITAHFKPVKIYYRLALAALITAFIGILVPQALGSGMGAIQFATIDLQNYEALSFFGLIVAILVAKFVATIFALGLSVPGGVIGPVMGIGVLLGAIFGLISQYLGFEGNQVALYAVLAMAGMMAATLHSPLAALVALLELTANPEIIAPAMLVIAVSYTVSVQVFGNRSIFIQQLDHQQLPYRQSAAVQTLQKIGVLLSLNRHYKITEDSSEESLRQMLVNTPMGHSLILADLDMFGSDYKLVQFEDKPTRSNSSMLIENSKIRYIPIQSISAQSTMAEAFELLQHQRAGAVLIHNRSDDDIIGIIHWDQLRQLLVERNSLT